MVETFLCIFNCGRPGAPPQPSASKSTDIHQPYDKMVQESSTHFTLHETNTTSRAVTTESIQRQLPSAPPAPSEQQLSRSGGEIRKRQQYLVNENYENNLGGSGNAPPVKGGQTSVPPYNANAPSSNVKHNQSSRISKSASSNPAQTLPLEASVIPQKQHRNNVNNVETRKNGNNLIASSGPYKNLEDNNLYNNSLVQNQTQQKQTNSRNQQPQYQSWSSKHAGPYDKEETLETKNPTHKHRSNPRHEIPDDTSKYEHPLSNEASNNPTKGNNVDPKTGTEENEGSAYWSATTGKADLIVHDSSRNVKSDKSSRIKNENQNVHKSSSHHQTTTKNKDKTDCEYNNPHHHQHKHKDHHHHASRNKSAGGGSKSYYDYNSSSNNKNLVGNNNYNTTSANVSDSKYNNSGVNNNVTGDNCNSDHRHRSRTHHAVAEPSNKRSSKKISSAMVPQHYYLSNTPDTPPPLPSCPPPPLDTPPPVTKSNTNQSHFSYNVYNPTPSNFSSSYKSSTSHNYQSNHPSSLDNRNKLNNSVHGDNNTVSNSSRSGGQQNKKFQDNEKPISPQHSSKHNLSNLKSFSDAGNIFSKSNPESSTAAGLAPSNNVESSETKLRKISTTAVISSESTSSSTVTNLQLDSSAKTSQDTKSAPNKSTGAIPKKKKTLESFPVSTTTAVPGIKPSTTTSTKSVTSSTNQNHLDEIVSFPLDDSISSSNVVERLNTSLNVNRTNLPHNLVKDSHNPSSSSFDGGSSSKHMTTKNSQRHYVQ